MLFIGKGTLFHLLIILTVVMALLTIEGQKLNAQQQPALLTIDADLASVQR